MHIYNTGQQIVVIRNCLIFNHMLSSSRGWFSSSLKAEYPHRCFFPGKKRKTIRVFSSIFRGDNPWRITPPLIFCFIPSYYFSNMIHRDEWHRQASFGSLSPASFASLSSASFGSLSSASFASLSSASFGSLSTASFGSLSSASFASLWSTSFGSVSSASFVSLSTSPFGFLSSTFGLLSSLYVLTLTVMCDKKLNTF